jgi:hypothetical protein
MFYVPLKNFSLVFIMFNVPLKNFSLTSLLPVKGCKILAMLGAQGL